VGKESLQAPIAATDCYFIGCWGKGETWRGCCEKMAKRIEKGNGVGKQRKEIMLLDRDP